MKGDLDVAIEGDLRTVDLGEETFDVIYSAYVLEHVPETDVVLANFDRWLKPGGLLILRIPDPHSARGFATRATPHWLHVFYYRYVLRYPLAGQPGQVPYPVFYHRIVSRSGIRDFCSQYSVSLKEEWGEIAYHGEGLSKLVTTTLLHGLATMSRGRLAAGYSNLPFILEKPAASDPDFPPLSS